MATARDKRIGRDELAELLWPDDYLDQIRIRLRQELSRLRQATGEFGSCLVADRQWVEIEHGWLTTDVQAFDDATLAAAFATDLQSKAKHLTRAVSVLNGPFLAGHQEPWVLAMRRTYSEKARVAWLSLAETHEALNHSSEAFDAIVNAVRYDPLNAETTSLLIKRLIERDQGAQAQRTLREFDALMVRELGLHAPSSMRALLESIESDFDEAVVSVPAIVPINVTRPLPLFGRDELLQTIDTSLSRRGARVLIVGMLGVGKTHVIHEAAWRFAHSNDLPVQFGGNPERVSDGLYVIDSRMDRTHLAESINTANKLGWRVLAESRARLESTRFEEILVNPLCTPNPSESTESIYNNPSVLMLASQIAERGTTTSSPEEAQHLAEIARQLDGLPSALRSFSSRLTVEIPGQVVERMDTYLREFTADTDSTEESIQSQIHQVVADLPDHTLEALISLSLLDGASADLASRLSVHQDCAEVWRELERLSLICVQGRGANRRLQVPNPVGFAVRSMIPTSQLTETTSRTWQAVGDWSYERSRQLSGSNQEWAFTLLATELHNLRRGLAWAIDHSPALAAYFTVATWRTVCARGIPTLFADLLYRGAVVGASLLSPIFAGEAWTGAGVTLSVIGRLEDAERAYLEAIRIFGVGGHESSVGWAKLNYAVCVVGFTDKKRALEILKEVVDSAMNPDLRMLAQTDYALMLASTGIVDESGQLAEEIFSARLATNDLTTQARAFVDLGEFYQVAGRPEAAHPLIFEGIRRLRDAGIQYMLLDQLVYMAEITVADVNADWSQIPEMLDEARGIATRIGAKMKLLRIARVRLTYASRNQSKQEFIAAVEETFQLTQNSQNEEDRIRSLKLLATELRHHRKDEYSRAIRCAMGEDIQDTYHAGWRSLLSTDSHSTICVLSVVLAKEALLG